LVGRITSISMPETTSTSPSKDKGGKVIPTKKPSPLVPSGRKSTFDKFDSFDDSVERDTKEEKSNTSLEEEVERLRIEVDFYRRKYEEISQSKRHNIDNNYRPRRNSTGKQMLSPQQRSLRGSVVELPRLKRNSTTKTNKGIPFASAPASPSRRASVLKMARSPPDTHSDDSNLMELIDLEAHASAAGLHHRHSENQKSTGPASGNQRRRDDESSYSSDDPTYFFSENDDSEREGLISNGNATGDDSRPVDEHHQHTFWQSIADRAGWLVGLLVLQSMSSFILARNEELLQDHVVIVQFLTMLVGAGGNAGNQASVRVIRGLAVGTVTDQNRKRYLKKEFLQGFILSLVIGVAGCIRAAIFMIPLRETIAITSSLFMIVTISIVLGALLPMGMKIVGIDPAHSSTTIQVIMVSTIF
jgi:cation transporter-like permease